MIAQQADEAACSLHPGVPACANACQLIANVFSCGIKGLAASKGMVGSRVFSRMRPSRGFHPSKRGLFMLRKTPYLRRIWPPYPKRPELTGDVRAPLNVMSPSNAFVFRLAPKRTGVFHDLEDAISPPNATVLLLPGAFRGVFCPPVPIYSKNILTGKIGSPFSPLKRRGFTFPAR